MKTSSMIGLGALGAVLLLGVLPAACSFNEIPKYDENVKKAMGDLESAYQLRNDKIPQLVSVADASANAEIRLVVETIKQRAEGLKSQVNVNVKDAAAMEKFAANQNALTTALTNMKMVVEKYPNPQFQKQFQNVMVEVSGTENRINVARRDYNGAVRDQNVYIRTFPGVIGNMAHGVQPAVPFKADEGARKAPPINFTAGSDKK